MKVMQVMAGAAEGGAETAFEVTCIALKERGIEICAVLRPNNQGRIDRLKKAGIEVHTLPFGGAVDLYTPWKIRKIIASFKPAIVQTWMSRAARMTPAAGRSGGYVKCSRLGGYYALKYFGSTDYFITNTPDIAKYLEKQGVDPRRIAQINNFGDEEQDVAPLVRSDLDTPDDAFVILSLARLHGVKALDTLIRAVEPITNAHLWLAGQGPEEAALKNLARDLGIAGRVHFLGWRDDRTALLKAANVCALPSRFEPFGTTFIQAWAHKVPLVCSAAQGPSQYVRDGEDALVFPIDDVAALTECLSRLDQAPDLRHRLAERGCARFLNEFTKEKTVDAYLDFYNDVLTQENIVPENIAPSVGKIAV